MIVRERQQASGKGPVADGMRILVAEDEFLVAVLLEEDLKAAGWTVVGPFSDLDAALEAARRERFDLAVLDINLKGRLVYPLADELSERGIPLVFLSGYGWASLPSQYRSLPRILKPYDPAVLIPELRNAIRGSGVTRQLRGS